MTDNISTSSIDKLKEMAAGYLGTSGTSKEELTNLAISNLRSGSSESILESAYNKLKDHVGTKPTPEPEPEKQGFLSALGESALGTASRLATPIATAGYGAANLAGNYLGKLGHGANFDEALNETAKNMQDFQETFTYQPQGESAQKVISALEYVPGKISQGAEYVGGKLADAGYPLIGALVFLGTQSVVYELGLRGIKLGKNQIVKLNNTFSTGKIAPGLKAAEIENALAAAKKVVATKATTPEQSVSTPASTPIEAVDKIKAAQEQVLSHETRAKSLAWKILNAPQDKVNDIVSQPDFIDDYNSLSPNARVYVDDILESKMQEKKIGTYTPPDIIPQNKGIEYAKTLSERIKSRIKPFTQERNVEFLVQKINSSSTSSINDLASNPEFLSDYETLSGKDKKIIDNLLIKRSEEVKVLTPYEQLMEKLGGKTSRVRTEGEVTPKETTPQETITPQVEKPGAIISKLRKKSAKVSPEDIVEKHGVELIDYFDDGTMIVKDPITGDEFQTTTGKTKTTINGKVRMVDSLEEDLNKFREMKVLKPQVYANLTYNDFAKSFTDHFTRGEGDIDKIEESLRDFMEVRVKDLDTYADQLDFLAQGDEMLSKVNQARIKKYGKNSYIEKLARENQSDPEVQKFLKNNPEEIAKDMEQKVASGDTPTVKELKSSGIMQQGVKLTKAERIAKMKSLYARRHGTIHDLSIIEGDIPEAIDLSPEERTNWENDIDRHEEVIDSNEERDLGDILSDLKTVVGNSLFGDETGSVSFKGWKPKTVDPETALALQRLTADAERVGMTVYDMLVEGDMDPKMAAKISGQCSKWSRDIKPGNSKPINTQVDDANDPPIYRKNIQNPKLDEAGNIIREGRKGVALKRSDIQGMIDGEDLDEPLNILNFVTTPRVVFEKFPKLHESLYKFYNEQEGERAKAIVEITRQIKEFKNSVSKESRSRLAHYAIAQEGEKGMKVLEAMGLAENIPELTSEEMSVYDKARQWYEEKWNETTEVNEKVGKKNPKYEKNYFPFMQLADMEHQLETDNITTVSNTIDANRFNSMGKVPNRFSKFRRDMLDNANLDFFSVWETYANVIEKYNKMTPVVEKTRALTEHQMPILDSEGNIKFFKQGEVKTNSKGEPLLRKDGTPSVYRKDKMTMTSGKTLKPNLYTHLKAWADHISGKKNPFDIQLGPVTTILNTLKKNIGASMISFNETSAALHVSLLRNGIGEIGTWWVGKGMKTLISPEHTEKIFENCPILYSMLGDPKKIMTGYTDFLEQVSNKPSSIGKLTYKGLGKLGVSPEKQLALAKGVDTGIKEIDSGIATFNSVGMIPLKLIWKEAVLAVCNGAYEKALSGAVEGIAKGDEAMASKYATDITIKSTSSTAAGHVAPIQRSVLGRAITLFGTFPINNWNYIVHDVLKIGKNEKINPAQVLRMVITTTVINSVLQDVMHGRTPFPSPIHKVMEDLEKERSNPSKSKAAKYAKIAADVGIEFASEFPLGGQALAMDKNLLGAIPQYGTDVIKRIKGDNNAPSWSMLAGETLGIGGTNQVHKTASAIKRHKKGWDLVTNKYYPKESKYSK